MKMRTVRVVALCTVIVAPAMARAQLVARATPAQVSGPMTIAWADPITFRGKPRLRAFVYDEATRRTYEVQIDSALAATRGGLLAMNGRRVTLHTGSRGIVTRIASVALQTGPTRVPANLSNPILNTKALTGTRKYAILGCRYSDNPVAPWPIAEAAALWNTNPVSVRGYWKEVSDNRFDVTADAKDWKVLPHPKSHYVLSSGAAELQLIEQDCIAAHDATVDFAQYDGIAFQMSSDLGCCAVSGGSIKTLDGQQKFYGMVWIPGNLAHAAGVTGTYTHELGHNFGLLHTVPADENTYAAQWSVMSDAFAGTEGDSRFGAQIIAAQKEQLGWISPSRRYVATAPVSTVTLERNAMPGDNANYQVIVVPIGASERFYAIELRKAVPSSYDRVVPLEGVVIHDWYMPEVIPWASKVVDADGNGDSNDAGAVWTTGETFLDARNGISITVESIGATSAQVTIRNGAGVAFQTSATGLKRTMVAGSAPVVDSIRIGFDGSRAGSFTWTAEKYLGVVGQLGRGSWLQLLNSSGSGSGQLRLRHDPAGMGAGVYVDSVRISSPDFIRSIFFVDTLEVTAPAALFAGLSVRSRSDSNIVPFSPVDSVHLSITGTGASSAAWTATKRRASTRFLDGSNPSVVSGTGSGTIHWMRDATAPGFTPGVYVDTITVSLTGTAISATVIDTFVALPQNRFTKPLTRGKRYTQLQGAGAVLDSAEVGLEGRHGVSGEWKVIGAIGETEPNWFLLPVGNFNRDVLGSNTWRGVGNGWFRYMRGSRLLAPGTYIDTLTVTGPFAFWEGNPFTPDHQGKQYVIDTLDVLPTSRSITFVPAFRYDTLVAGLSSPTDSVRPVLLGPGSAHQEWVATARGTLDVPNYMGSTTRGGNVAPNALSWARNIVGKAPGLYVDTIDVTTTDGSPITAFVVDTVVIVATAMQVARARTIAVPAGAAPAADSLDVALLGAGGGSVAWTATNRQPWNSLTAATGTGTGKVRWTRNIGSLAVGTYVDTITVSADAGSVAAQRFIDTVRVRPGTVLSSIASRSASRGQGQAPVPDSASITITGDNASSIAWTATSRKAWTTLTTASGFGSGMVRWTKAPGSLTPASYVDTITIAASDGVNGATIVDTLVVIEATTLASSAASRLATTVAGHAAVADSADVTIAGPVASTVTWTATKKKTWTTLTTSSGTGSGRVRWTRDPGALSAATYVDTITIAASDGVNGATIIDTLVVGAQTILASSVGSRRVVGSAGQAPIADSASVTLTGPLAPSVTWTATKTKAWTTLTTASGTGSGKLRWKRSPHDLTPGTYVDTITIAASDSVHGATIVDTVVIGAPIIVATANVSPDSSAVVVGMEVNATLFINLTPLAKALGSYAATVTWDSTIVWLDSVRSASGGFTAPAVTNNNAASVTLSASDSLGKAGLVPLARLYFRVIADAPAGGIQTSITPTFTTAESITSQETNLVPAIRPRAGKVVHVAGALRGDVNLDGRITSADAQSLMKALVKATPAGMRSLPNGDANCNGKLEAVDAQIVLRKLAGLPVDQFCVGTIK